MRPSSAPRELVPNDVFGAFALQTQKPRPILVKKTPGARFVLVGESPRARQVLRMIEKLGRCRWPALLQGEQGTGKEVVARQIYNVNPTGQFVMIDCPSIRGPLMEEELFGRAKGAAEGVAAKIGLIERANDGTAFFDEIDALPLELQGKLLRVLQEKEYSPVGSSTRKRSDFRIIAATSRNLAEEVEGGTFRRDLFFRLNVINIRLAPLRERKEDIPELVNHFLSRLGGKHAITKQATEVMLLYDWPGNVRELESCIQYMLRASDGGPMDIRDFPETLQRFLRGVEGTLFSDDGQKPIDLGGIENKIPKRLWEHAIRTFGSALLAKEWFGAECGALDNRPPIDVVPSEAGRREVDRILGCIDHGMIA
jgi:DNA-binding NtrC family response regulator